MVAGQNLPLEETSVNIHPLAVVDPTAFVGRETVVGPFCIVEAGASIGERCTLESHVVVRRGTTLGNDNRVFEGAILGGPPQHSRMPDQVGEVVAIFRQEQTEPDKDVRQPLAAVQ